MKKQSSLQKRFIRIIAIMVIAVCIMVLLITMVDFSDTVNTHYTEMGENVAKTVSALLDNADVAWLFTHVKSAGPDEVARIMKDPDYLQIDTMLTKIRDANSLLQLYMILPAEEGTYIIFDANRSNGPHPYGKLVEWSNNIPADAKKLLIAGEEVPVSFSDLDSGWGITVAIPHLVGKMFSGYIVVEISMNTVVKARLQSLGSISVLILLVALFNASIFGYRVNKTYITPIKQMTQAASTFIQSMQSKDAPPVEFPEIRYNDELNILCESMKKMETDLDSYVSQLGKVTAEKERISTELDIATKIQASMLPCIFPAFPERDEFEVYATMNPAKEVGGDFYDFFMVDEDHLALVVADVSGKGVPAALFMVIGKTLIKDHTTSGKDLGEVFTEVNQILCESNSEEMFITAFVGVLDLRTGIVNYVNAGHEIPFISKKNGPYVPHKVRAGFVLAGLEKIRYKSGQFQLEPGDKLFQYTDGVTEATDINNQLYGMDRLEAVLSRHSSESATQILHSVKADVDAFVDNAPQFDDITMLCVEYKGPKKRKTVANPSMEQLPELTDFLETILTEKDVPFGVIARMNVALDEIFSNIVKFSGASYAEISCGIADNAAYLIFEDDGVRYNPLEKEDVDISLSAEEREIGGLGILMVKKSMDKTQYKYENGKNILTLRKKI